MYCYGIIFFSKLQILAEENLFIVLIIKDKDNHILNISQYEILLKVKLI